MPRSTRIAALTAALVDRWETLYQEQGNGRRLLPGGSLLWSRDWGWCVTATSPAQAYHSGYISVETAAADHPEIQEAVILTLLAFTDGEMMEERDTSWSYRRDGGRGSGTK